MRRSLVMFACLSALTLMAGCGFFEALTTDSDGAGPEKSPAAELAEAAGKATIDYAGLIALLMTGGKTLQRTFKAMRAKKKGAAA